MRRWIWIVPAVLSVAVVSLALFARPWVRQKAISEAEERGVLIEVARVELSLSEVRLLGVQARLEGVDGITAELDELRVRVSGFVPRVASLDVLGGQVTISGTVAEVKERLSAFRARRGGSQATSQGGGPRRRETLSEVDVVWKNALGEGGELSVSGLALSRGGEPQVVGGGRLGADLVELTSGALSLQVAGVVIELDEASEAVQVSRAGAAEMRLSFQLDAADSGPKQEQQKDDAEPSQAKSADDGLGEKMTASRDRVVKLRAALALFREKVVSRLPKEVAVERLFLKLISGSEQMSLGPSRLSLENTASALKLSYVPGREARGTPLEVALSLPHAGAEGAAGSVRGGPVSLGALGVSEGAFGLSGVKQAFFTGDAEVSLSADAEELKAKGTWQLENLALDDPRISEERVVFPSFGLKGAVLARVDGSGLRIEDGELTLGEGRFLGGFSLERKDDRVLLEASLKAPLVSCQALADSTPRGLLGAVGRVRWDGTFSLDAGVKADSSQLSKMAVHFDFDSSCKVKAVPQELDPQQFRGQVSREVRGPGGVAMSQAYGPGSLDWTPYDQISPFLEAALLVTEDGRFFRHQGFDNRAIGSSIRDNARAGRFVRGASTISMQLAKNLYLSREKTLSRKLKEAALTLLLEQAFEKKELLELYVNAVEFGPGVYGVGRAAAYYFNTTPGELSAAQCFFLASILPAPSGKYFDDEGNLSEARTTMIRRLLTISHKREALTDDELALALLEEPKFGQKESLPEGAQLPGTEAGVEQEGTGPRGAGSLGLGAHEPPPSGSLIPPSHHPAP